MVNLFITSLNEKVREVKPGILSLLSTIKLNSKGNLFADLKLITAYVLPKLNTLAAIEQQLSDLNLEYENVKSDKQKLDEELRKKIGEITGLTKQIEEKVNEINEVKQTLLQKDLAINNLQQNLTLITNQLDEVKKEKVKLMEERNVLINKLNEEINKLKLDNISGITSISDIPDLLIKVVNHLKKTNQSDEKLFKLINIICKDFFNDFLHMNLQKEINNLDDLQSALNQINLQIVSKLDGVNLIMEKYSNLFSNNLLFENKLSTLDSLLEDYLLLIDFKNNVKVLVEQP